MNNLEILVSNDSYTSHRRSIYTAIELIEAKKNVKIHNIPELSCIMHSWQMGRIKDFFFKQTLSQYLKEINALQK